MNKLPKKIVMVGPDPNGLGGISRVVSLWQFGGYFSDLQIEYISSVKVEKKGKMRALLFALMRFTFACLARCRVVYIHTASFNSFYRKSLFMVLAILMRHRLIVHIHPSYFSQFIFDLRGVKKYIARAILSKASAFIVLTPEIKENMGKLFPDKPIYVLNNPIDIRGMENRNGLQRSPNSLLFLGWYMKRKGVYELVDAIGMLLEQGYDVSADFYGTKEVEKLQGYVSDLGLNKNIRINGWIGEEEKLKALYSCNVLVLPSHTEGIPNVILEAMATKTPIVSTLVGGLREVLRDGENAVIAEPANATDLSKKIIRVLQDKKLALQIADNAYKQACEKYDLPIIKECFRTVLNSIAPLEKS
jgi:glycosyltransferase involved in cell wall biosynthesis